MDWEKLLLLLFSKFAEKQDDVLMHLHNSKSEMVKFGQESLQILSAAITESGVLQNAAVSQHAQVIFDALATFLTQSQKNKPFSQSNQRQQMLRQIVNEILQVLNEEKEACQSDSDALKSIKIGYLDAISTVLRRRFLTQPKPILTRSRASKKRVQNR